MGKRVQNISDTQFADLDVLQLKGVGPKVRERLEKMGITRVQDLLFHLPFRYQNRTRITPIGALQAGEQVVVEGEVEVANIHFGHRRSLLIVLADGSGRMLLRFFHFNNAQRQSLVRGARLRCYGETRLGPRGFELIHPEYVRVGMADDPGLEERLTPIYPTTEGMHQLTWRSLTSRALDLLDTHKEGVQELLPAVFRHSRGYPALTNALKLLHRPPVEVSLSLLLSGKHPAQQRLVFEELLAHQLSLRLMRHRQQQHQAPELSATGDLRSHLLAQLPFSLTAAQLRVVEEILVDMRGIHPMLRLVQGDVGSGKTVVAALAALQAVESGYQVALMAPTELLAEQHARGLSGWLQPLGITAGWISSRLKGTKRKALLERLQQGEIHVLIGTHALFQEDVAFPNLGLVIIDEQHRFGVHQRLTLREKGRKGGLTPHQLIMTATPIPRTLAMTAYADLDLSIINELPPGRTPVTTIVLPDGRRDEVIERVRAACSEGRQVYWVCTLIEESEVLQCQTAEETASLLSETLQGLRVGLVHGRLKAEEKERVMATFSVGEIDLLVATTVIEVGVDVPNASLMIIENSERLGLAQLHQLRGRVGRGSVQSHCVLMYRPPLSANAQNRLQVMRESNDGFIIAQKDLEIRGPGEVLGTRQTGELQFRIADVMRDQALLPEIQRVAEQIEKHHTEVIEPLLKRWIGEREAYINV